MGRGIKMTRRAQYAAMPAAANARHGDALGSSPYLPERQKSKHSKILVRVPCPSFLPDIEWQRDSKGRVIGVRQVFNAST